MPMYDQLEVQLFNDIICQVIGKRLSFLLEATLSNPELKEKLNEREREFAGELLKLEFKPNRAVVCNELWDDHPCILFTHICGQLYYEKYIDSLLPIVAPVFESCVVNAATATVCTSCSCSAVSMYKALIISHKDREHYYTMVGNPTMNCIGTTRDYNKSTTGGSSTSSSSAATTPSQAVEKPLVPLQFGLLAGSKVALNGLDSYSGCVSLCNAVALSQRTNHDETNSSSSSSSGTSREDEHAKNIFFSPEPLITGSHRSSIAAINNGRADIASIDCITWAVLNKHSPEELANCRVIGETALAPLPPIVMSKSFAEECPTIKELLIESIIDTFSIRSDGSVTANISTTAAADAAVIGIRVERKGVVSIPSLRSTLSPEEITKLCEALVALGIVGALRTSPDIYVSAFDKLNSTPTRAVSFLYGEPTGKLSDSSDATQPEISSNQSQFKSNAQSQSSKELDYMEKLDLCGYELSFPITTSCQMARVWCNRGMLLCYGFNHDAAVFCFQQALGLDPACIFAHWGAAYSYGENYNYKEVEEENMLQVNKHVSKALELLREKEYRDEQEEQGDEKIANRSPLTNSSSSNNTSSRTDYTHLECALVRAVAYRSNLSGVGNAAEGTLLYSAAMKAVYYDENQNYSNNCDIAALYAESLINIRPWNLWPPRFHRFTDTATAVAAQDGFKCALTSRMEPLAAISPSSSSSSSPITSSSLVTRSAATLVGETAAAVAATTTTAVPVDTLELGKVLSDALKHTPRHPGLVHLKVHYGELGPKDVLYGCIDQAHMLRSQWPGVGHLSHMSSHIDMQVGMYAHGVHCNVRGVAEDRAYNMYRDPTGDTNHNYHGYLIHSTHMLTWGAMFCGDFETAIKYSESAFRTTSPLMFMKYIDYMEPYMTDPWHVLIRFGKWHDILNRPIRRSNGSRSSSSNSNSQSKSNCDLGKIVGIVPKGTMLDVWAHSVDPKLSLLDETEEKIFLVEIAFSHYARGVAFAALGDVDRALEEQELFRAAVLRVPSSRHLHNVSSLQTLSVAESMLAGEIAYRDGYMAVAFDHLREAVSRELTLPYDEPPGWMFPCRHALGALQLEEASRMLQEWCNVHLDCNSSSTAGSLTTSLNTTARSGSSSSRSSSSSGRCCGRGSSVEAATYFTDTQSSNEKVAIENNKNTMSSLIDDEGDNRRQLEPLDTIETLNSGLGLLLEAEMCYRHDLDIYPCNLWSLGGLSACMKQFSILRKKVTNRFEGQVKGKNDEEELRSEKMHRRIHILAAVKSYYHGRKNAQDSEIERGVEDKDCDTEYEEEIKLVSSALEKALLHSSLDIRAMFSPVAEAEMVTAAACIHTETEEPHFDVKSSSNHVPTSCFCAGAAPRRRRPQPGSN